MHIDCVQVPREVIYSLFGRSDPSSSPRPLWLIILRHVICVGAPRSLPFSLILELTLNIVVVKVICIFEHATLRYSGSHRLMKLYCRCGLWTFENGRELDRLVIIRYGCIITKVLFHRLVLLHAIFHSEIGRYVPDLR